MSVQELQPEAGLTKAGVTTSVVVTKATSTDEAKGSEKEEEEEEQVAEVEVDIDVDAMRQYFREQPLVRTHRPSISDLRVVNKRCHRCHF